LHIKPNRSATPDLLLIHYSVELVLLNTQLMASLYRLLPKWKSIVHSKSVLKAKQKAKAKASMPIKCATMK